MQSFLQGSINLKSVPKLTFTFISVIKMYNELEASGFVFLLRDLFGLVQTGNSWHPGVLPNPGTLRREGFVFFGSTAK